MQFRSYRYYAAAIVRSLTSSERRMEAGGFEPPSRGLRYMVFAYRRSDVSVTAAYRKIVKAPGV
jgi:hypothetical protein